MNADTGMNVDPDLLEAMVEEVFRRRAEPRSRLMAERGMSATAMRALSTLRSMPYGDEWRVFQMDGTWRIVTEDAVEQLGCVLVGLDKMAGAGLIPNFGAFVESTVKAVKLWERNMPLRQWSIRMEHGGITVDHQGDVVKDGQPCRWQLTDVEDRAVRAAAFGDWTTWELFEAALDGCGASLDAAVAMLEAEAEVYHAVSAN
jgi:hypothetical protein